MSAWVPSKAHIDAMVSYAIAQPGSYEPHVNFYAPREPGGDGERFECSPANATLLGQLLVTDVVTAVSHRYPGDDVSKGELPGPIDAYYVKPYEHTATRVLADGEMVHALRCYSYQACEHEQWNQTFGHAFVEAMNYVLLTHVREAFEASSGAEVPWGFEREHVETDAMANLRRALEDN